MKKWNPDPVEQLENGSWIFWDETWAYSHGPFETEEIAREHFVALTTVRSQIRAVLQKLGVRSQLAAVAVADAHRWLLPAEAQPDRDRRRQQPVAGAPELSFRSA